MNTCARAAAAGSSSAWDLTHSEKYFYKNKTDFCLNITRTNIKLLSFLVIIKFTYRRLRAKMITIHNEYHSRRFIMNLLLFLSKKIIKSYHKSLQILQQTIGRGVWKKCENTRCDCTVKLMMILTHLTALKWEVLGSERVYTCCLRSCTSRAGWQSHGRTDNVLELQKISQFVCLVSTEPAAYTCRVSSVKKWWWLRT